MKSFSAFRESIGGYRGVKKRLEFNYTSHKLSEKTMLDALIFWAFIQTPQFLCRHQRERRGFLNGFLGSENRLVRLIAHVEKLPVRVWHKILWKHNVDNASFESFLRRITPEQEKAIYDNYRDYFEEKVVPRVFGRVERFFKRITLERLKEDAKKDNHAERNLRKSAMAYNLLGLDFGFNAYPKGVGDDTKVVSVNWRHFFAGEGKDKDFVVNTKDGRYIWLYVTARSNAAYNYGKKVSLKRSICPGFWLTLIAHAIFWVISPALLLTSPIWMPKNFGTLARFLCYLPFILLSLVTPLWMFIASLATLGRGLAKIVPERAADLGEKAFDGIKVVATVACVIGGAIIVCVAVGVTLHEAYVFLRATYGVISTCAIMGISALYLGNKFYKYKQFIGFPKFKKLWLSVRVASVAMAVALFVQFTYIYGMSILAFALSALLVVAVFLRAFGWASIFLVVPFAFIGAMALCVTKMSEQQWVKFARVFAWVFYGLAFAILALAMALPVWAPSMLGGEMSGWATVAYTVFWAVMTIGYVSSWKRYVTRLDPRYQRYAVAERRGLWLDPLCLMQSKWLSSLEPGPQIVAYDSFADVAGTIFRDAFTFEKACSIANEIAPKLDERLLNFMREHKKMLRERAAYDHVNAREIILAYAAGAASYNCAVEELEAKYAELERKHEKFLKRLKTVFFPVVLLWRGLCWVWEITSTLYGFRKWFKENCPITSQPEPMRLDFTE